jgi:hypothetical protein
MASDTSGSDWLIYPVFDCSTSFKPDFGVFRRLPARKPLIRRTRHPEAPL